MKQRSVILLVFSLGLVLNAAGYLGYRALWARPVAPIGERAAAPIPSARHEGEDRGRARREEGLSALKAGEYDRALASFAEAQALMGERADIGELVRITQDLQTQAAAKTAAAATAANTRAPKAEHSKAKPAPTRPPRPLALRAPPAAPLAQKRPAQATEPSTGVLLVSTTPRGLLVHLDGEVLDLSPMRTTVKAGAHQVSLYDGERKLLETTVEVIEGEVATLRRDLTTEIGISAARGPIAPPAGTPAPPEPIAPGAAAEAVQPAAAPPSAVQPAGVESPPPAAAQGRGDLNVTSPGLYAEVWINGRFYGFPPVVARNLPAGAAEVEVRVNGVVKRKASATIQPGQVVTLKVR